jgi:ribosomal protein S18 acetylase RimI-like enzyme
MSHVDTMPSVRRATAEDAPALVSLMQAFYAEAGSPLDGHWASSALQALLSDSALGAIWLVSSDAQPVGHAVLAVRYTMEYGGLSGYIDDLFVRPAFRRSGVGRRLLDNVFAECRSRGCRSIQVEVGAGNAPAVALYASFGLTPSQDDRVLLSAVV